MAKLKTQVKRFLARRLTSKIMDQLVGLSDENKTLLKEKAEKSSAKIIKAYLKAIKQQQKNFKAVNNSDEKIQVIKQPMYIEPAVMAS